MAKQNFGGVYANMEFPPYTYQPYPRHIHTGPHGQYEVANSEEEETQIRARLQKDHDDAPAAPVPYVADPAKEILISRARELGVPFNALWSKAKLQKTVDEAEAAVDDLPPEELPKVKKMVEAAPEDEDVEDSEEDQFNSPEDYKDHLIAEANSLGIKANKLWGIPRLKSSIAEANANKKKDD